MIKNIRKDLLTIYLFVILFGSLGISIHWISPIFFMLLYLILGLTLKKKQWNVNVFADSFYFLGFSFTLISLLISLNPSTIQNNFNPILVLNYMGIALSTTVFGVIVRTIFVHFREDLTEDEMQEAIHDLSNKLLSQMKTCLNSFEVISVEMEHTFHDKSSSLIKTMEASSNHEQKVLENLSNDISNRLDSLSNNLTDKMRAIEIPPGILADKIDKSMEELTTPISNLKDILVATTHDFQASAEDVNQGLKKIVKGVSITDNKLSRIQDSLLNLYTVYESGVNKFVENLSNSEPFHINLFNKIQPTIDEIDTALKSMLEGVDNVNENITYLLTMKDHLDIFDKTLKNLAGNFQYINTEIKESTTSLLNFKTSIHQIQESFDDRTSDVFERFDKKSEGIKFVVDKLKKTVDESIDFINKNMIK